MINFCNIGFKCPYCHSMGDGNLICTYPDIEPVNNQSYCNTFDADCKMVLDVSSTDIADSEPCTSEKVEKIMEGMGFKFKKGKNGNCIDMDDPNFIPLFKKYLDMYGTPEQKKWFKKENSEGGTNDA